MRHSLLPKETLSDVKFEVEEAVALAAAASPTPSCASSIAGPISIYGDSMVLGLCEDRCNSCVMISLRPVAGSKTENRWKAAMEKRDGEERCRTPAVEKSDVGLQRESFQRWRRRRRGLVTPPDHGYGGNVRGLGDVIQVSQHIHI